MLVVERGATANTIESYRRDLALFASFCQRTGVVVEAAGTDTLRAFLAAEARAGRSPRTTARRLSALRQFFRFLYGEEVRPDDPSVGIDAPRRGRPLPKYLSVAEVGRLFDAAVPAKGPDALRFAALLEILYAAGLRVSELVGLPLSALVADGTALRVRGKGGRERVVPLTEPARAAIAAYLPVRDAFAAGGEAGTGGAVPLAVPVAGRQRPPDPRPLRPASEGGGNRRRPRCGAGVAARAPSLLRQPSGRPWRRPAQRPADAGSRRHRDDANLYARPRRPDATPGGDGAPARPAAPGGDDREGKGTVVSLHTPPQRPTRPNRSQLTVPGSSPRFIDKAQRLAADIVLFDLEDAVPVGEKENARRTIAAAINDLDWGSAPCRCASTASTRPSCTATSSRWWNRRASASTW